ncbi:MAG TPA: hypothetical protein VMK66_03200 [Myxococcales bacterium]|nr:hypothetical protein [Myxococcales bacterium]
MAVLLNQTSNLRLRLSLRRRLSDGTVAPASLEMAVGVDRYQHREEGEHAFVPMLHVERATLLDMDLIQFLQALEELLEGRVGEAALEASVDPAIGLRLQGGPEAFLVEVGIDLLNVLESVGGLSGERGSDLALYRFAVNKRAALAFCAGLIEEFGEFPTDPRAVNPGEPA